MFQETTGFGSSIAALINNFASVLSYGATTFRPGT